MAINPDFRTPEQLSAEVAKGVITIERGLDEHSLAMVENELRQQPGLKLVLIVDPRSQSGNGLLRNLDVLPYIPSARCVSILVNSSTKLDDISPIAVLKDLRLFHLSGNYKPTISLASIERFGQIESLLLENGISKKQSLFVETLSSLSFLSTSTLDLADISLKPGLKSLVVTARLSNHHLLASRFPVLESLALSKCPQLGQFDFLDELGPLKSLSLNHMSQLETIPVLRASVESLQSLRCAGARNLVSIDSILKYVNLRDLFLSDLERLTAESAEQLSELGSLQTVYLLFMKTKERERFEAFRQKQGWSLRSVLRPGISSSN